MSDQLRQKLQQAEQYLQAKNYFDARNILLPLVQSNPDNAEAWWLLARAQTDPNTQRDMLKRVVKLDPGNGQALEMLARLDAPPAPQSSSGNLTSPLNSSTPPLKTTEVLSGNSNLVNFGVPVVGTPMATSPSARGRNNVLFVLLGVAGTLVCLCLICGGIVTFSVGRIATDPTFQAALGTGIALVGIPKQLPTNALAAGDLTVGHSVESSIGSLQNQAYTYQGSAGEQITVTLTASSSKFAALLGVYDTDGSLIKGTTLTDLSSRNLTISVPLSTSGTYTVLVVGMNNQSSYTLKVTSSAR